MTLNTSGTGTRSYTQDPGANLGFSSAELRALAVSLSQVYIGELALTQPRAYATHQRTSNSGGAWSKGTGPVPFTINPSEPVSRFEMRLRDASSPATVLVDWAVATPPLAAGSQTIQPLLPAGLYDYLVDFRANEDDQSIVSTAVPVRVGEVLAIAGQSWAQDLLTPVPSGDPTTIASAGLTISPWGRIFAAYATNGGAFPAVPDFGETNYPPTSWDLPSDSGTWDGTGTVELFNRIIALLGVPVGLVGYAVGGTGIDTWLPGYAGTGTAHYEKLIEIIASSGTAPDTFLWFQGHYESKNGNTGANYALQLAQLRTELGNDIPSLATARWVMASIPGIGAYSGSVAAINDIRAGAIGYAAANAATTQHVDALDATQDADLVHAAQDGNIAFARQVYRGFAKVHGFLSHGARGPEITGATRAYGTSVFKITCTNPNGGTAWNQVGSALNQFTIYPQGTTTGALTLSAIDLTHFPDIWITTSTAITEPAGYDIHYRRSPDDATIIDTGLYDDATDGDGIALGRQLALRGTLVNCSIPVVALTIAAINDDDAGAALSLSGTYSNGLPASLEYSVDGGSSWASAATPTIGSGNWSFAIAAGLPVGTYKLRVRDPVSGGYAESNTFVIAQVAPPSFPSISGNVLLIDASQPSGHLYADTNRTVAVVNNQVLRGVADLSGAANHFSQIAEAFAPRFLANVKNGLPGIRFDGTLLQFLEIVTGGTLAATLKSATAYTIFAVYTPLDVPAAGASVFAASERAKSGGFNIVRGSQGLSSGAARGSRNADAIFYQTSVSGAWVASQVNKQVDRYTGSQLKTKINALSESTVSTGALGANAFDAVLIGAERGSSIVQFHFNGYLHCLGVWTTSASDGERDSLITYGTTQWG